MLLRLALLAAVPLALAEQNATYIAGLLQTLHGLGVNNFSNTVQVLNSTATGQNLLNVISDGQTELTLFAPNDGAFVGLSPNISDNPQILANVVSYHVVAGNFSDKNTTYPNVTVGRTYLNDSNLVALEGNKSQVLVWTMFNDSMIHILNQNTIVTVTNTSSYGTLTIYVIDAVLNIPMYLISSFAQADLNGFRRVLSTTPYTFYASNGTAMNTTYFTAFNAGGAAGVRGYTMFAPNDAALAKSASSLAGLANNQTAMVAVVQNHIINGTSLYSPLLMDGSPTFISSAGEGMSFQTNSSGTFVMSGNSKARIVQANILVNNGVVHVIDCVLLNEEQNTAAASSAFDEATSIAAITSTATGPVGSPTGTPSSASAGIVFGFSIQHAMVVVGVLAGALLV